MLACAMLQRDIAKSWVVENGNVCKTRSSEIYMDSHWRKFNDVGVDFRTRDTARRWVRAPRTVLQAEGSTDLNIAKVPTDHISTKIPSPQGLFPISSISFYCSLYL